MNDDFLARSLTSLAEDMPDPDIGDIVATARARIRRRRAIGVTVIAIAAVVGALAATSATTDGFLPISVAHRPTALTTPSALDVGPTPMIDDHAWSLDQQFNQALPELIPAGTTVSRDPLNQVRVNGKLVGAEFYSVIPDQTSVITDRSGTVVVPPVVSGIDYVLDAKLSDARGWGTVVINTTRVESAAEALPSCAALAGTCQATNLPDGTRAVVLSQATANGGTDIHLVAIRPDRTYVDVTCTNLPTSADTPGASPPTQPTRQQPPLSAADLVKFATAFTY
ncbi:MAG TPA: hypothetical protein VGN81_13415 [Pseudonocardiaceae bacterium]|jgi:hypothetical protein